MKQLARPLLGSSAQLSYTHTHTHDTYKRTYVRIAVGHQPEPAATLHVKRPGFTWSRIGSAACFSQARYIRTTELARLEWSLDIFLSKSGRMPSEKLVIRGEKIQASIVELWWDWKGIRREDLEIQIWFCNDVWEEGCTINFDREKRVRRKTSTYIINMPASLLVTIQTRLGRRIQLFGLKPKCTTGRRRRVKNLLVSSSPFCSFK